MATDDGKHIIRVTAPGYAPKSTIVTFEKDVDIDLHLERNAVAPVQQRTPPVVTSTPRPPPPGTKKRVLDSEFPLEP
jgi:hypothetical protein